MSQNVQIYLDTREFDRTIGLYAAACKKDFAYATNRAVKNLGVTGVQLQKEAEASAIQALEKEDWWPKYVAKRLHAKTTLGLIKKFSKAKNMSLSRAQKLSHYTREQAQRYSKQIIRKRLGAMQFLKFFFVSLARAAGGGPKGRSFKGFEVYFRPATNAVPTCDFRIAYEYKARGDKTEAAATRLLESTLSRAIVKTTADMKKHIESKMEGTARQYSARAA